MCITDLPKVEYDLAHASSKFYREQKVRNWPRFSTPPPFSRSCFKTGQDILTLFKNSVGIYNWRMSSPNLIHFGPHP